MLAYPAGQDSQTLFGLMYFPAPQAAQNVAPASELVPFAQSTQDVWPAFAWYVFASHSSQSEESDLPVPSEYLPGGHSLQSVSLTTPVAEEYLPLLQS